jgi:hypothetical protein
MLFGGWLGKNYFAIISKEPAGESPSSLTRLRDVVRLAAAN